MITRTQAKNQVKTQGWSQRQAAKHLGYTFTHFNLVLNGHRISKRLLTKIIEELPKNPNPMLVNKYPAKKKKN